MKKILLFVFGLFILQFSNAQLLVWSPDFAKETDNILITVDGTKGNQALAGFSGAVYIHTGVITSASTGPSDWKYSKFTWGTANAAALATSIGNSKWTYNITGGIRAFYGVPAGETILKIAVLFRDAAGNTVQRNVDASDMFIPIYDNNLAVRFNAPPMQPKYSMVPETITVSAGATLPVTGVANLASAMKLYLNGTVIQTASNATTISANPVMTSGNQQLVVEAITTTPAATKRDTINFFVSGGVNVASLPAGVREGINYISTTSVTLVLYAPNKTKVSVIGEFPGSNWTDNASYQMNKTPDGNYWWITISSLTAAQIYAYQYLVEGALKTADPYTEMVLDPNNDQYITSATYPNMKAYPTGLTTGIVGTLQTAAPAFNWTATSYTRPDKRGIVVYELLLRDFLLAHDYSTLKDTLNYLKNLGITAIELMPINEFDGNESWGYNPSFFMAPDKYYGPKTKLKEFIDAAHAKGIAVIMDIAMNHATGEAPEAKMYWNSATNQPTANNPWFNVTATHPYSVFNDFNHESTATKYLVDRVVEYWLTEYKIDGFRWDLSKGFTQTNNPADVAAWSAYDLSRINIWKRIYDVMQAKSAGSYCILEHLGDNQEEKELANYGMMPWGKVTDPYNQVTMGFQANSDFSWVFHTARGWSVPNLVGYAESHDEERTMYKNLQFGNASGSYDVKSLNTALQREEMFASLFLTIPGPKMLWEFEETGYDFSINTCANGTISSSCRLDKKPLHWEYMNVVNRKRLYDVYASLNNLRKLKPQAFIDGTIEYGVTGLIKWIKITHSSLKLLVVANMDVAAQTASVTFQNAGTWYSYLDGGTITATGASQNINLTPGEYHVYLDQNISGAVYTSTNTVNNTALNMNVNVFPNPIINDATINYDLPENGKLEMTVLNKQGQKIGTIFNGYKVKGTYSQSLNTNLFNSKNLANGMYLLKINLNNKYKVEKLNIMH